jgi:hypothetical protein
MHLASENCMTVVVDEARVEASKTSEMPPIADIRRHRYDGSFVPKADISLYEQVW